MPKIIVVLLLLHRHAIAATVASMAYFAAGASDLRVIAPVESCQFVARRSPWGRLGSVLDVGSRLHRVRGGFHRWIQISTGPQQCAETYHDPPKFWIQSYLESPKQRRMRRKRLPDPRPIPEGAREPICPRKK